ncbi:hypothetical protein JTE90_013612 [Oedothorax gibbosus]|uniref:Nephrin n=1 Tax=Oedothorax gibbosus TaxID=931172 RepID=A0AAV6UNX5_9ARAC|nr:hypothetical protein JTE90_013612 [Oedothorax gibbosus]
MIVIGVAGTPVHLPCNITPEDEDDIDDAIALVLWYKDEATTPIYSLDARQGTLDQARHAAKDELGTRARLSIAERPAVLKLDPALVEDEGEYKCRADFKKARTRYMAVYLKVVVAPGKPVITDRNKEVLQSLIGPYNEGEPLVLVCDVTGGVPTPTVTWWRESVLLDDTQDVMANGVIRNELTIQSLQRHDLMAVLSCQATNNNVSMPASSTVTVDMNFRPLDVMIEGDRQPLSAHKTVELVCRATGSRPPAVITWWKGTSKLKALKDNISVDGNVTTSIITMTPSGDDNGKHLSCRAENPFIAGSAIEYGWKLEVHYLPQLTLRLGSKLRHSHIQEGNDVYLDCSIVASPWVSDIGWRFAGQELHTDTAAGIIVSNQSLVLQKVSRTSRGHYTCVATNSEGEGESNVVQLRVQYAPLCKPGQKVVYGAARHEAVNVLCEVEADPRQVNFRWEFNSSSDNLQVLRFVPEGLRSVATYVPRSEQDYGTLICWAENSVGRQKDPCVYIVVPAGPPDPVQNCLVTNHTEDSFRVECSEGYDGGVSQHFVLEVYEMLGGGRSLVANRSSSEPVFLVRGLKIGTEFLVVVFAVNSKGRSESIALRASTLTTPESLTRIDDVWQVSFSPILVVLLAIVIGVVLLALIIVLIVKFRKKPHHRKAVQDSSKDDKCQTPLRKDTDDDWKSCSCAGEEKCPDIIPAPLREGALEDDEDMCGDGLHWRTSSVDTGILTPDSYSRSKLSASGMPLLQSSTPQGSQELSLQPTLLQEYSPTRVLLKKQHHGLLDAELITTTSRQTKV